jgi:hypothetical protein
MKQKAIETKLIVRPIIGCLTHTHFWEGPCRAGYKKDMTSEAESAAADAAFVKAIEALKKSHAGNIVLRCDRCSLYRKFCGWQRSV